MKLEDGTIIEIAWSDCFETPIAHYRRELKTFGLHIYTSPLNWSNVGSYIIVNRKLTRKEVRKFAKLLNS